MRMGFDTEPADIVAPAYVLDRSSLGRSKSRCDRFMLEVVIVDREALTDHFDSARIFLSILRQQTTVK
jgi:hypothetical protein